MMDNTFFFRVEIFGNRRMVELISMADGQDELKRDAPVYRVVSIDPTGKPDEVTVSVEYEDGNSLTNND